MVLAHVLEPYEYHVVLTADTRAASSFHAAARQDETAILEYFVHLWNEDTHDARTYGETISFTYYVVMVQYPFTSPSYWSKNAMPIFHNPMDTESCLFQSATMLNASIDMMYYLLSPISLEPCGGASSLFGCISNRVIQVSNQLERERMLRRRKLNKLMMIVVQGSPLPRRHDSLSFTGTADRDVSLFY
jgi:hypothetical protein